jgi:hypothetical protein
MGIIEAGCIDKEYASSVQGEVIGELDLGGTGFQVRSDSKIGTTAYIDELQNECEFTRPVGIIEHTLGAEGVLPGRYIVGLFRVFKQFAHLIPGGQVLSSFKTYSPL